MNRFLILAALAGALGLSACNQAGVTASDAQALSTSFCQTWLPSAAPIVENLNKQLQADYATVTRACDAIGQGKTVNLVTVAVAAVTLYQGVTATYPKLTALSDRDLLTAARLIDVSGIR